MPLEQAVLYPNPVRFDAGHAAVRLAHVGEPATVTIYTLEGQEVCTVTDREDGDIVWTLGTPSCLEGGATQGCERRVLRAHRDPLRHDDAHPGRRALTVWIVGRSGSERGRRMDLERARDSGSGLSTSAGATAPGQLPPVGVEETRRLFISPTWESGFDRYNDQRVDFHRRIAADGGVEGQVVLDYGCGDGYWALYLALVGARRVVGFDLAESGIRRGMRRVVVSTESTAMWSHGSPS